MSRRLVNRANALILAALVGLLLLVAGMAWDRFSQVRGARAWLRDDADLISTLRDVDLAMWNAEAAQRGFLLTGDAAELGAYRVAARQVPPLLARLQPRVAGHPAIRSQSDALSPRLRRRLDDLARSAQLRIDGHPDAAVAVSLGGTMRASADDPGTVLAAMVAADDRLHAARVAATDRRALWVRGLMVAMLATALLALLWAVWILNRAWADAARIEAGQRVVAVQLRTSLDSLSQGVAVFDADHALSCWNGCFQTLLDLPRPLLVAGMPYGAFAEHAAGGPPLLESDEQVRREWLEPNQPTVHERVRADGAQLELRRSPTPDGGFVLTVTDMTRRAQAEAVLREAQKMQAIGQLTGGIAHDFNNLLTVILGNLELARSRLDADPAMRARIERATWAAQRGAALTAQLLAVARKQPLAPASIDLAASMPELVPLLRRTLGEDIEVGYQADAGLWPAMADPSQLENAVLNLALNARDAMPDGGRLTILLQNQVLDERYAAAHHEVVAGDYAMLAVADSGHGMTPDVLARVFEPFFTTKPDGKGTGLGLPMVFGFVKQSGGHVKIESEVGRGTTVRLYLPRAAGAPPSSRRPAAAIAEPPRGSATILVVEDEPAVRHIAVAMLSDLGYRVLEADDGEAALRIVAARGAEIALMLTDVVLPGRLRGRELTRQAVLARPGLRVLYMSGYTEDAIMRDGRLDEGVTLIGKPFQRDELARRVAQLLLGESGAAGAGAARLTFAPSVSL